MFQELMPGLMSKGLVTRAEVPTVHRMSRRRFFRSPPNGAARRSKRGIPNCVRSFFVNFVVRPQRPHHQGATHAFGRAERSFSIESNTGLTRISPILTNCKTG